MCHRLEADKGTIYNVIAFVNDIVSSSIFPELRERECDELNIQLSTLNVLNGLFQNGQIYFIKK